MSDTFARYPSLAGKVVYVTGGASGIGAEIVTAFANQGARVGFVDLDADASAALCAAHSDVTHEVCDLRDIESFLAWAREDFACVIFNLHTEHDEAGIARSADAFRGLIAAALVLGGSYFLTYHRWATRGQIERAYPQFAEFLRLKEQHDRGGLFQSEWWRHHRNLFAET